MTPTEQDKELFENSFGEWLENHGVELIGNNPSHLGTWQAMVDMNELKLAIMQLFTADRKRVALGARIDEINYLDDNFQADSQDWEREHPGYSTAMIPMEDYIRRRTELKQELEKL